MTGSASSLRWAAALLGVLGLVAAAGAGVGACTSGITPSCDDAQCAPVVDAAETEAEAGDDGTAYASESGAESGGDDGSLEAAAMEAGSPDSSDSGDLDGSHDTGVTDANDGGSRDAPADG